MKRLVNRTTFLFAATVAAFALLSPKWLMPIAGWVAPALMLLLISGRKPLHVFLLSFAALYLSGLVANFRVIPFPVPFLLVVMIQLAIIGAIPYVIFVHLARRLAGWKGWILFPVIMVASEYITSFGGGGTWGSIAYSQVNNLELMQLASVTGLWGISFILYWFNVLLYRAVENRPGFQPFLRHAVVFVSVLAIVFVFGMIRLNPAVKYTGPTVRLAAITGLNVVPLLTVYEEVFGKKLDIDPMTLTQSSPELVELNNALARFIESPLEYQKSLETLVSFQDSLFRVASREAHAGAKLIVFSEALMFTIKPLESDLIIRGRKFAQEHNVRLLLTMGSFIPGKVEFGTKYIENKAIMINESGEVENVFFKNKPVPVVEGSLAGDGEVPVLSTSMGKLATSICYDADFPYLMRKAGARKADIMLLPSGDWSEVAPYHADMARVRAIENGFAMVRPVSGATTIICDDKGRIIGARNFYDEGERVLIGSVPVNGTATLYAFVGDVFAWLCLATIVLFAWMAFAPSKKVVTPTVS